MSNDPIHPCNLPRDFVQAMAVCITLQAFNNKPCHVQAVFDGLYGTITNEAKAHRTVQEFTALMNKMLRTGLITMPNTNGEVILTDHGDEAATAIRSVWEQNGYLHLSDLIGDLTPQEGWE
jgi:hypothetical protein